MTRKDELAEKLRRGIAKQIRNIRAIYPTTLYDEPAQRLEGRLVEELCAVAQQVEREVLERVIAGYLRYKESLVPKPGCEKFPIPLIQTFEEWLRAQQKELG